MWSSVLSNQRICDGQQFSNNGFPIFVEESESDTSLPIFIEPVVHSEDEGDKNSVLRVNSTLKSPSKIVPNDQAELNPSRTNATGSCSCENTTVALTLPTNGGKRFAPLQSSTPVKKQRKQQTINATEEHTIGATEEHERCTAGDLSVWKLSNVVNLNGCKEKCATTQHGLTEYDILSDHCGFDGKTQPEQNNWISQYFGTHCPSSSDGSKDIKNTLYIVRGKPVCLKVWLAVLSLSTSRFYRLRQLFVEFGDTSNAVQLKRRKSLSTKTKDALAWMEHYFNKVGDKRPDKESILLPTCLTEKRIHEILIEQLYHGDTSKAICLSQFNKLFREEFKNVSIPKRYTMRCAAACSTSSTVANWISNQVG
ncbi:uncharacterized protein [Dysidea avara]|uniref:uncharacterized protein isoform X2 n=1 Tax=Dysidea avara TaxID=196820 RepID=UPI003332F0D8